MKKYLSIFLSLLLLTGCSGGISQKGEKDATVHVSIDQQVDKDLLNRFFDVLGTEVKMVMKFNDQSHTYSVDLTKEENYDKTVYLSSGIYDVTLEFDGPFQCDTAVSQTKVTVDDNGEYLVCGALTQRDLMNAFIAKRTASQEILDADVNSGKIQIDNHIVQIPCSYPDFYNAIGSPYVDDREPDDFTDDDYLEPNDTYEYSLYRYRIVVKNTSGQKLLKTQCTVITVADGSDTYFEENISKIVSQGADSDISDVGYHQYHMVFPKGGRVGWSTKNVLSVYPDIDAISTVPVVSNLVNVSNASYISIGNMQERCSLKYYYYKDVLRVVYTHE